MVQSDDWEKLIADKIIKNEYPDQNGYIPNQFNITPADESFERASAGSEEAHDGSKNHGNDGGIDTEPKGYKHTLYDEAWNPFVRCCVKPEKILGHYTPVPLVLNFNVYSIGNPDTDTSKDQKYRYVQTGNFVFQRFQKDLCSNAFVEKNESAYLIIFSQSLVRNQ
jgi:hypothetical protein